MEKQRFNGTCLLGFLLLSFVILLSSPGFADFVWETIAPLPTPRQAHMAVGTSDTVYVFGGNTGGSQTSGFTADAYNLSFVQ